MKVNAGAMGVRNVVGSVPAQTFRLDFPLSNSVAGFAQVISNITGVLW